MLDTSELRVHLFDGRRLTAKVVVTEPARRLPLQDRRGGRVTLFRYRGRGKAAADWRTHSRFANQFQIATREGHDSAAAWRGFGYAKVHGKQRSMSAPGAMSTWSTPSPITQAAPAGIDANRHGELLGLIGKRTRNSSAKPHQHAVPIQALGDFVLKG